MKKKMIMVAMSCDIQQGSESAVGWNFLLMMLKQYEVFLIAKEKDRPALEALQQHCSKDALHLTFIPWEIPPEKNWLEHYYHFRVSQNRWHQEALQKAMEIEAKHDIAFVWKTTPCGFRSPGEYYKLKCPSVWGPVSGFIHIPVNLLKDYPVPWYRKKLLCLRTFFNLYAILFIPLIRKAFQHYDLIFPSSQTATRYLEKYYRKKCTVIVQSGVMENDIRDSFPVRAPDEPLKIVFAGRPSFLKGFHLLLNGLSKVPKSVNWELHVYGTSDEIDRFRQQSVDLNIAQQILFHGKVSRDELQKAMGEGHLFVLLAILDLAPNVLTEAFSVGLPVIALDWDGFNHVVNNECGRLLRCDSKEHVTEDFVKAMEELYKDEGLRQKLAKGALQRAHDFSYELKEKKILADIAEIIQ